MNKDTKAWEKEFNNEWMIGHFDTESHKTFDIGKVRRFIKDLLDNKIKDIEKLKWIDKPSEDDQVGTYFNEAIDKAIDILKK